MKRLWLLLLLLIPFGAYAKTVDYGTSVVDIDDSINLTNAPDMFSFRTTYEYFKKMPNGKFVRYNDRNYYLGNKTVEEVCEQWGCDELYTKCYSNVCIVPEENMISEINVKDELTDDYSFQKYNMAYFVPAQNEYTRDKYIGSNYRVKITCDSTKLDIDEETTCRLELYLAVPYLAYQYDRLNYIDYNRVNNNDELTYNLHFNLKSDELEISDFIPNPNLQTNTKKLDYNYKFLYQSSIMFRDYDDVVVADDRSIYSWYGIDEEDPYKNFFYGMYVDLGTFKIKPKDPKTLTKVETANGKDALSKIYYETSINDPDYNVDLIRDTDITIYNLVDKIPKEEVEVVKVEEVKGEEEVKNPPTGLFNYVVLLLPITLLVGAYLFFSKKNTFKQY